MSLFRVLIVDDHPIVLAGLKLLLQGDERFDVSGEARSARAACIEAERLQPDVIVTDLIMGEGDGLALIEDLRATLPAARIIVYSSRDETVWGPHVIYAGAHGYVAKSEPLETVAVALERVVAGAIHVSEPVQQLLIGDLARRRDRRSEIGDLSGRRAPREPELPLAVLRQAKASIDAMLALATRLLDAHAAEHRPLTRLTHEDVRGHVLAAAGRTKPLAQSADVRIEVDLPDRPLVATLDAGALAQILDNLLSNAVRYSPTGGVLTIGALLEGRQVEIRVQDRGPGIDPAG